MTEVELRRLILRYRLGAAPAADVIKKLKQELERLDLRQVTGPMPETRARIPVLIDCEQRRSDAHRHLDRGDLDQAGDVIVIIRRLLERVDAMFDAEAAVARAEAETVSLAEAIGAQSLTALPSPRAFRDITAQARAAIESNDCRFATAIAEHVIAEIGYLLTPSTAPVPALPPLRAALGEQRRREIDLLGRGSATSHDPAVEAIDQLAATGRQLLAVHLAAEFRIETAARHRCLERLWLLRVSDADGRIRRAASGAADDAAASSWRDAEGRVSCLIVEHAGKSVEQDNTQLARLLDQIEAWS